MEEKSKANRRRRERALKMRAEISESAKASEDSCEESIPLVRSKPPRPRKKNKEAIFEEDVIDGFAMLAFKSFEDLERCVRFSEKSGSRTLDPYPYPERAKEFGRKKNHFFKVRNNNKGLGSHSSSEQGYICDSESEGDKLSDEESDFFRTDSKAENRLSLDPSSDGLRTSLAIRSSEPSLLSPSAVATHHHHLLHNSLSNGPLENNYVSSYPTSVAPTNGANVVPAPIKLTPTDFKPYIDKNLPPHYIDQKPSPYVDHKLSYLDQKALASPLCGDQKLPYYEHKPPTICPPYFSPLHQSSTPTQEGAIKGSSQPPHHFGGSVAPNVPTAILGSTPACTTAPPTSTPVSGVVTSQNYGAPNFNIQKLSNGFTPIPPVAHRQPPGLGKYSIVSLVSDSTQSSDNTINSSNIYNSSIKSSLPPTFPPNSLSNLHLPPPSSSTSVPPVGANFASNHPPTSVGAPPYGIKVEPGESPLSQAKLPPPSSHLFSRPISPGLLKPLRHSQSPNHPISSPYTAQPPLHHSGSLIPNHSSLTSNQAASPHLIHHHLSSLQPPTSHQKQPQSGHSSPVVGGLSSSSIKMEPGVACKAPPPSVPSTATPSHLGLPPGARHSPAARQSPRSQDTMPSLYGYPTTATSIPSSLSKPWSSPVGSSSRMGTLPRPIIPPPSLPLGASPVSAPLPPTGMFAPNLPNPQSLMHNMAPDPLAQADILRRELDSRFLATQDRSLSMAPPGLGPLAGVPALLRTDVHHHQHQHTHVHQHLLPPHMPPPPPPLAPPTPSGIFSHSATPSLFKEVSKLGIEASIYRPSGGLTSYPGGLSPLVASAATPFVPPVAQKKTGRWNAMHVRIAWEIFYDQQKQASEKSAASKLGPADLLRPPGGPSSLNTTRMYPTLAGPPDLGPPSIIGAAGPSGRLESSFLPSHMTGLAGLRYGGLPPGVSPAPPFHHPGITPTSISGPPPGSMFSRDPVPTGLSLPTPLSHEAWRLRAPTPYGSNSGSWPMKSESSPYFERERREQEERERRDREEHENREKEERERREREERERREREQKERERERRAEHEKERQARIDAAHDRGGASRREESRSPLRSDYKDSSLHHMASMVKGESRPSSRSSSRPDASRIKMENKDDVLIVGSKEGIPRHHTHTPQHLIGPPSLAPPISSSYLPAHSLAPPIQSHCYQPTTSSPLDRNCLIPGIYASSHAVHPGPHMSPWVDPFRDPYRAAAAAAAALHDPMQALRSHEFAARESMLVRDPLRQQLSFERAREEQFLRGNPLGSLILNERFREQQARELIERERERQLVAAAAVGMPPGLYPPASMLGPPSAHMSLLPASMKPSPLTHPGIHPGLHPAGLGALHHGAPHPVHLGPPLPPPMVSSLRGSSPVTLPRTTDKKDPPR